jgi:hypothetical protein
MLEALSIFHKNYEQLLTIFIFHWTDSIGKLRLVSHLKKSSTSRTNLTRNIEESIILDTQRQPHSIYQKRTLGAT